MPNDPHDPMLPPLVEDHEQEAFKHEVDRGMVVMLYICIGLLFTLGLTVAYFLITIGGTV